MSNQRAIIERPDGGISVLIPSPNAKMTFDEIVAKDTPADAVSVQKGTIADVPSDRTFRNAWVKGTVSMIDHDMPKAVALAQDKVREARVDVLARLDADYMRMDEQGNTPAKQTVASKKQQARDATADVRITGAADVVALKAGMESVIAEIEAM